MAIPRITKVFAAVNIGSFRTSAMIAGLVAKYGDATSGVGTGGPRPAAVGSQQPD